MMWFFGKKRAAKIEKLIQENANQQDYWSIVRKQFSKNRLAVWSLRVFYLILFVALFADFIANDKPYYCELKIAEKDTLSTSDGVVVRVDTLYLPVADAMPVGGEDYKSSTNKKSLDGGSVEVTYLDTTIRTSYFTVDIDSSLSDSLVKVVQIDSLFGLTTVIKVDSVVNSYFPVFKDYAVSMGFATWEEHFTFYKWHEHDYETAWFPPITYRPETFDKKNKPLTGPTDDQKTTDNTGWHYLGTDNINRDVAAGMIHGTRVAMLVGIVAMSIATLIGIFFGALAGYFGDDRLKVSRIRIILNILAFILFLFYGFIVRGYALTEGNFLTQLGITTGLFVGIFAVANILVIPLKRIPFLGKKVKVAMDILVMRFIEIVNSVPVLVLILSVVAIIETPSLVYVMAIIGLVSWTGIAKFLRAELLRVRNLEYIEAAQAFGFSNFRIILRHAIPNALAPVLIAIAFGIASAILTESFLSFIGVGVPAEQVTWGSLLSLSRQYSSAWWLAIFPGMAIFFTVTIFNLLGEGLTDALDPRTK